MSDDARPPYHYPWQLFRALACLLLGLAIYRFVMPAKGLPSKDATYLMIKIDWAVVAGFGLLWAWVNNMSREDGRRAQILKYAALGCLGAAGIMLIRYGQGTGSNAYWSGRFF